MKGFRVALWGPLLLLASALTVSTADAAEEIGLGLAYDPRAPLGSFRGVVPDAGFGGLQIKWDYFALDELSIGLDVQYNGFRRGPPREALPGPNGYPTAPTYQTVTFWSFLPTARYYLSTGALRPYAELGAGLSNASGAILLQDLSRRDAVTTFIVQPSVGVLMRLSRDTSTAAGTDADAVPNIGFRRKPHESMFGVTMAVTYAFTTADVGGAHNVAYAGFQLGIYAKP